MPYRDKVSQREAVKKATQKYRKKEGITEQGITKEGITEYRPIIIVLSDPIKRAKLRAICESLSGRGTGKTNQLGNVWYGVGKDPTSMFEVDELLTAF